MNEPAVLNATAAAWAAHDEALAAWVLPFVNRVDVWGGYRPHAERGKKYTKRNGAVATLKAPTTRPAKRLRGHVFLTRELLARHFRAAAPEDVVGLHTTGPDNTSRWGAFEIDWHSPDSMSPDVNWSAALGWYEKLVALGFRPLLTDSNGKGGYHQRVFFNAPVPTPRVFAFLQWLLRDFADYGLPKQPEKFPKQPRVDAKNPYGNWLRLPGLHHTREHWSRVWTGSGWAEGEDAVRIILSITGDSPDLIPKLPEEAPQQQKARRTKRYTATTGRGLVNRIRKYMATLPNLGDGQGRDDVGYTFAAQLVRDFNLSDDDARPWLEEWDNGNSPPKGKDEIEKWLEDARKYGKHEFGAGLNGSANGATVHAEDTEDRPDEPPEATDHAEAVSDGPEQDVISELLAQTDVAGAIDAALEPRRLEALARLTDAAPGEPERLYRGLEKAGATVRAVTSLRQAVNRERKRLKRVKAEEVREQVTGGAPPPEESPRHIFTNFWEQPVVTEDGKEVVARIGFPVQHLGTDLFRKTNGWPKQAAGALFVEGRDHRPRLLEDVHELFAWIGEQLPGDGSNQLRWATGPDKVLRETFLAHLLQTAEAYDAVESFPHYPPIPRHYYMHPPVRGGDGKAFRELLRRFCPATDADYDLIEAMFLTLFWGGRPGQRPAQLVTSEEGDFEKGRGVGKTKLVTMAAKLAGGHADVRQEDTTDKLITRLLSRSCLGIRCVLLDNLQSLRFSDAEVEALITNDVISGHKLYEGEGQRPNTLNWFVTINSAALSRDMAQRCCPIKVKRPPHDDLWEEQTLTFIEERRWEIIGDILAKLAGPGTPLRRYSRWGAWEAGVLSRVADPAEAQKVIEERQGAADDDAGEAAIVRERFVAELTSRRHDPVRDVVFIPSALAALIVNAATGENRPVNKANSHLGTLAIREIRRSSSNGARGWAWRGLEAEPDAKMEPLDPL